MFIIIELREYFGYQFLILIMLWLLDFITCVLSAN